MKIPARNRHFHNMGVDGLGYSDVAGKVMSMIQDNDRPTYHHLPPEGLLWDACAAMFRNGRYHLFFLHSSWAGSGPARRTDGYMYKAWAHISSADLVHWDRHPDAIERGQTGNIFLFNETPTIIYPHPDGGGASCIATNPEGDLIDWQFKPSDPVLRHPVQGPGLYPDNNDVTAWQQGEWCYALTGTRDTPGKGDTLSLFRSRDLGSWEYEDRFYESERRWTDAKDDCSCPDFFEIGSRWMLLHFCHQQPSGARYYLGRFENDRFYPEAFDRINWPGGNIHAPRTMLDDKGRRILFANLNEGRDMSVCQASGWYGVMSLPVVISLASDGNTVCYEPPAELQALREDLLHQIDEMEVEADTEIPVPQVRGDCLELDLEMESRGAAEFGLKVRCAPDGREETLVFFSREPSTVQVDYGRASMRDDLTYQQDLRLQVAPFDSKLGESVRLRVFLDRSVLEVFAGDQRYLAQRIFPTHPDALGVKLFSRGGPTLVRRLRAWRLSL
ncbi:MAG: glycoside hydrolase family 32 protein [Candidatus Latescibacterota bacterium]|nr:glycoside hydrolase family 32 protein [Candidatus Latescibacterota bacterium]